MEQTALRPKPLPGDRGVPETGDGPGSGRPAGRTPGRRPVSAWSGLLIAVLLVLSGAVMGATGAAVVGVGGLVGPAWRAAVLPAASPGAAPSVPVAARLGVEVADDRGPGARVVGVHVPGPGSSAGLVRGDVVLAVGAARVDSAADLARAVARARPGEEVTLTVRRRSGGYQQLTAVPGLVA
ncbi:PDZ domain-containing protein [Streptomyces capillispiralis]|uniref:PDZ domain-containing protein n=1 Tax=Streptomyces capillispiralis TaxID=68182 RepID=A0A561TB71_9ACTN|nr:PDZ domain-containing protein [Streptomyces capillispiralis]TWF84377.1 PDZ domain-containing protein [Streptomyces capillispiralis]GHH91921.1 hypothetical protein GCM10017779_23780 [Streptomyces capillispiralis]